MNSAASTIATLRRVFWIIALCASSHASWAIAPPYVSDEELTRYPIIVVATWDKASFRSHANYSTNRDLGKVVTAFEAYTELSVRRVIKGAIQPGVNTLKIGYGVSWSTNGDRVTSGTSTELPGDVDTVVESNLWFLKTSKSWDGKDTTNYLTLDNYRDIQPLVLEKYFAALGNGKPEKEVRAGASRNCDELEPPLPAPAARGEGKSQVSIGLLSPALSSSEEEREQAGVHRSVEMRPVRALLASTNSTAVRRGLSYACDGIWPWPYDSDFTKFIRGSTPVAKKRAEYADALEGLLKRKDSKAYRGSALVIYADLAGVKGIAFIRTLLRDDDPVVRLLAAGLLARQRDTPSIPDIVRAMDGSTNDWSVGKILDAITTWGDERLVPALANYLEVTPTGYEMNGTNTVPFMARQGLHRMTGHWFPFDTQASLRAWRQAQQVVGFETRKELLAELLPNDPNPLSAEVLGDGSTNVLCKVTNKSKQDVTIAKFAKWGDQRWPGGLAGASTGGREPKAKGDFITLKAGESTEFPMTLYSRFLLAEPRERQLTVHYTETGRAWGINAWVGTLTAEFGTGWKGQRKLETVEEKWPNGNLKTKGQTMNGEKYEEWQFFNEAGDRIRTINYSRGGSAECNPDYPSNKGAGKVR